MSLCPPWHGPVLGWCCPGACLVPFWCWLLSCWCWLCTVLMLDFLTAVWLFSLCACSNRVSFSTLSIFCNGALKGEFYGLLGLLIFPTSQCTWLCCRALWPVLALFRFCLPWPVALLVLFGWAFASDLCLLVVYICAGSGLMLCMSMVCCWLVYVTGTSVPVPWFSGTVLICAYPYLIWQGPLCNYLNY